jgi:segregation and condensation protein B
MPDEIRNKIEAILFSCGRKISIDEIAKLSGLSKNVVRNKLVELQNVYSSDEFSMMIHDEGELWKMTVKEKYMSLVRSIVAETELPKAILETLAVIAWKAPILQSDVVKLRNNKAYEHVGELETAGFIIKERLGRSYKLKLAQKFFNYFDVDNIKALRKDLDKKVEKKD